MTDEPIAAAARKYAELETTADRPARRSINNARVNLSIIGRIEINVLCQSGGSLAALPAEWKK